jgi:hypothetical protein
VFGELNTWFARRRAMAFMEECPQRPEIERAEEFLRRVAQITRAVQVTGVESLAFRLGIGDTIASYIAMSDQVLLCLSGAPRFTTCVTMKLERIYRFERVAVILLWLYSNPRVFEYWYANTHPLESQKELHDALERAGVK